MNAVIASPKCRRFFPKSRWLAVLVGLALALANVASVCAYWTAPGTGTGKGTAGTLAATTITGAAQGSGLTANLTWAAVTPPGSGSVAYYVRRDAGNPGGNCPTPAAPKPAAPTVAAASAPADAASTPMKHKHHHHKHQGKKAQPVSPSASSAKYVDPGSAGLSGRPRKARHSAMSGRFAVHEVSRISARPRSAASGDAAASAT